jgi:hypothetical protein
MAKDATITLRLNVALKAELEAAARQAERSLSAEIVYRLKQGRPADALDVAAPAGYKRYRPPPPSRKATKSELELQRVKARIAEELRGGKSEADAIAWGRKLAYEHGHRKGIHNREVEIFETWKASDPDAYGQWIRKQQRK